MSTYMPKPHEVPANWHVVDATGQVLGRLAARVSIILQGKHKPTYAAHVDTGDFVVVINADKIKVTGKKAEVILLAHGPAPEILQVRHRAQVAVMIVRSLLFSRGKRVRGLRRGGLGGRGWGGLGLLGCRGLR